MARTCFDVVQTVDQVEAPPLLHRKRAENDMRHGPAFAEEALSLGGDGVQLYQFRAHPRGQVVAAAERRWKRGRDRSRSLAAVRKAA